MADGDPTGGGILVADAPNPPSPEGNQAQPGPEGVQTPSVSDDSGQGRGWRKQIAEDLQGEARLDKFDGDKALDKVVRSYLEAETRLNEPIKKPGPDAPQEELSRYYARLGRPESPEGYDFTKAEMPDGYTMGEDTTKLAREVSHKIGLTPEQASEVASVIAARDAGQIAAIQRANTQGLEKSLEALQTEWGGDFKANQALAHRAIETHFKDGGLQAILTNSGMDSHPAVMRAAYSIAKATAEGAAPRGELTPPVADFSDRPFPVAARISAENRK